MIILHFHLQPQCGFIVQLVEHRTGIAEVTGSNPVEALISFRLLSSCLNWKIYCDNHSSLSNFLLENTSHVEKSIKSLREQNLVGEGRRNVSFNVSTLY